MKKNLKKIINEIQEENGLKISNVINDNDDLVNDLGLDSLDLAQLTVIIEDIYGVDIFEEKIIRKIYEIKKLINE
jgi:acyl carrier protein